MASATAAVASFPAKVITRQARREFLRRRVAETLRLIRLSRVFRYRGEIVMALPPLPVKSYERDFVNCLGGRPWRNESRKFPTDVGFHCGEGVPFRGRIHTAI